MPTHKDLDVWKRSMALVEDIYRLCGQMPANETYGLQSQMKRCVVSIPSNTAEGAASDSIAQNLRFLGYASGSLSELDTQLILTARLFGVDTDSLQGEVLIIAKMLTSLKSYYRKLSSE